MHIRQKPLRELFEQSLEYTGGSIYSDLLAPWVASNQETILAVRSLINSNSSRITNLHIEDSWLLYALSRVNQILLLRFQPSFQDADPTWSGPAITQDEYLQFFTLLGLTIARPDSFSAFHHEIVKVEQSDAAKEELQIISEFWPCLMLGNLMFSRAGAHVSGGRNHINKSVAESSTIYWAYQRKNRPSQDLSYGWGSNSQWRTTFRRDYKIGNEFFFNVGESFDLTKPNPITELSDDLTIAQRIELLTHRCFIKTPLDHHDLYPYRDTFALKIAT